MKYKVIGWVSYDDDEFEESEQTYAKINAIIDNIKENGYLFTGWHHQEYLDCTPLLNDGTKVTFSQRGFGGVMAEAHGYYDPSDYSLFTFDFSIKKSHLVFPKGTCDLSQIVDAKTLNETFTLELSEKQYNDVINNDKLIINDIPELRYIDVNDMLIIKTETLESKYLITEIEKERLSKKNISLRLIMKLKKA